MGEDSGALAAARKAQAICDHLGGRRTNVGWKVHCPAHDDQHPSLDLTVRGDKLLFRCRAGCPQDRVLEELRTRLLWSSSDRPPPPRSSPAKEMVARYVYRNPTTGMPIGAKERYEWKDERGGGKTFRWVSPAGGPGLGKASPSLYRAERLKDAPPDQPVEFVEGEKCVRALEGLGLLAVCSPHGAERSTGKTVPGMDLLQGRHVRLWPDNDVPGRAHMEAVARSLAGTAASITWVDIPGLAPKGDIADFLAAGHGGEEVLALAEAARPWTVPGRIRASDLLKKEIPPTCWAVEGILPEGAILFAGKAKIGKSWWSLALCLAVASGGVVLGSVSVERGDVLYLALEDNERRLQSRLTKLLDGEAAPDSLELWTECPRLEEGGLAALEEWLQRHPRARLLVIDTLKRVRPPSRGGRVYDEDYDSLQPLADLAHRHHVAIVVIHHLNKAQWDDPLDAVSGSSGLTASPDGLLVLQRRRGHSEAVLHVVHREGEEQELALQFDSETAHWTLLGPASEHRQSQTRREILDVVITGGPQTPKAIAEATGRNRNTVRRLLQDMLAMGELRYDNGRYTLPSPDSTPESVHAARPHEQAMNRQEPSVGAKNSPSVHLFTQSAWIFGPGKTCPQCGGTDWREERATGWLCARCFPARMAVE